MGMLLRRHRGDKKTTASEVTNYEDMTVADLKKLATKKGLEVAKGAKKDDIIEQLKG